MIVFGFADGIFTRVRREGLAKALFFVVARFQLVRSVGDAWAGLGASPSCKGARHARGKALRASAFRGFDAGIVVSAVEKHSWFPGFNLPLELVQEITEATKGARLTNPLHPDITFTENDKCSAEARLGRRIVFGEYSELAASNGAVVAICNDPLLRLIATRYLRREPRNVVPRVLMSFVDRMSAEDRLRQKQTVLFHYDLDGLRTLYFNFYLTDTDENSGAHVLVEGTHGRKRLRHLLGTTNISDDDIAKFYPGRRVVTVRGRKGFGFVEDPYCFHKALPPRTVPRLLLQIRCW
jgi:hypothetical protein